MAVLDRVREVAAQIEAIQGDEENKEDAASLAGMLEGLRPSRETLESACKSAEVLTNNGAFQGASLPLARDVKETLAEVLANYDGRPKSLRESRRFQTLKNRVQKLVSAADEAVADAWAAHVATAPKVDKTLIAQIEKVETQRAAVRKLRDTEERMRVLGKARPTTQSQWDEYESARAEVADQLRQLDPEDFPQSALEFCAAAQAEGARLEQLTPEVKEWLESHSMLSRLRLRLADND